MPPNPLPEFLADIAASPVVNELISRLTGPRRHAPATGQWGSCALALAAIVQHKLRRPMLVLTAHLDDADDALSQLQFFRQGCEAALFPAYEVLPGESNVSQELVCDRLELLNRLAAENNAGQPSFIVAPVQAIMQPCPDRELAARLIQTLKPAMPIARDALLEWLGANGYTRLEAVEDAGDCAVRGDIVDVWPPGRTEPVRISFFGDEIEKLHSFNPETLGPTGDLTTINLLAIARQASWPVEQTCSLLRYLSPETIIWQIEPAEMQEQAKSYYDKLTDARGVYSPDAVRNGVAKFAHAEMHQFGFNAADAVRLPCRSVQAFDTQADAALAELAHLAASNGLYVLCGNHSERTRLIDLLDVKQPGSSANMGILVGELAMGFRWRLGATVSVNSQAQSQVDDNEDAADIEAARWLILVGHHEIFHRHHQQRPLRALQGARPIDTFLDLREGDYVVHVQHGIAKYIGLNSIVRDGKTNEFLTLSFAGDTKLQVPVTQVHLVQKYVGNPQGRPQLSVLGGAGWGKQKEKAAEAIEKLAVEMLEVQAARAQHPGVAYPADTPWMKEFENAFQYEPTEDQVRCITEIKEDLQSTRPMDRLLCGDVGYGKTELAIRSAFKVCEAGKQVAVLAPTTVLVEQHEQTFRQRMAGYPFVVESISRFKSTGAIRQILQRAAAGQVDVLIGSHRLLSRDVQFADLGLLVIDEEQRFGVEHKERLKHMRLTVDVLTMSATPIPRTLHMSLLGLRDISNLATPPRNRRSVVTEVIAWDGPRIAQAIKRELARDGQIYFVHNRVWNIDVIAEKLRQLVPDARILIGHGQMPDRDLEQVMHAFVKKEADILVSTTIIESGLDIPSANTMFIHEAENFGLSDLHQLRGRVGRSKHRAYCYLIVGHDRVLTEAAGKRLKAMEEYASLGAGFKIALRDLEIRGAGNLLGEEQSGHIAAVGYELYCQLLEEAVKRIKNLPPDKAIEVQIDLGFAGSLPRSYVASDRQRMDLYRRLARCSTLEGIAELRQDITDAFGDLPRPARVLIDLTELKLFAAGWGIRKIIRQTPDIVFTIDDLARLGPLLGKAPGSVRPVDANTIHLRLAPNYFEEDSLLNVLRNMLNPTAAAASAKPSDGKPGKAAAASKNPAR